MRNMDARTRNTIFRPLVKAVAAGALCLPLLGLQARDISDLKVDDTPIDRDGKSLTSYAPIIEKSAPSVVSIWSERKMAAHPVIPEEWRDKPFLKRFFGAPEGQPKPLRQGLGSGLIVTSDGYILSNYHVVEGAEKIEVWMNDGKERLPARVIGTDPQTDIAVLKVDAEGLPAVTFADSDQLEVGDVVFALGNPMGVGQSVSMGIISALSRGVGILGRNGYEDFIQTDAAINQGNSGGPLIDMKGRVIGVNQSIVSRTGGNDGIGFAIPVNLARNVLEQLITNGAVQRGYIGISIQTLSSDLAEAFEMDNANGALITEVVDDSPGDSAGLKAEDVILQFDGRDVEDSTDLRLMASQTRPGTKVDLKVLRKGREIVLDIKLGTLPTEFASMSFRPNDEPAEHDGLDGVTVDNLGRDERRALSLPSRIRGALVVEVDPQSNAFDAGLREGDVIVEINHRSVDDAGELVEASEHAKGAKVLLKVWTHRGGGGLRFIVVNNTKDD